MPACFPSPAHHPQNGFYQLRVPFAKNEQEKSQGKGSPHLLPALLKGGKGGKLWGGQEEEFSNLEPALHKQRKWVIPLCFTYPNYFKRDHTEETGSVGVESKGWRGLEKGLASRSLHLAPHLVAFLRSQMGKTTEASMVF